MKRVVLILTLGFMTAIIGVTFLKSLITAANQWIVIVEDSRK